MKKLLTVVLTTYQQVVLTTVVLLTAGDILFLKPKSDPPLFGIVALYLVSMRYYRLSSKMTFLLALLVVAIMGVAFAFTGTSEVTERAAVWLFFLMGIGLVQQIKE